MEIVTSEFWRFDFQNHLWSKNLTGSSRILLDIYGMERGNKYRNKTCRKPWSGHRITYSSSSICCGLGILYPSWSRLTIFLPSIRGYGEPPKKEKVTSCYNTLLQGMSSPKICCFLCCCFYWKWKKLTVSPGSGAELFMSRTLFELRPTQII